MGVRTFDAEYPPDPPDARGPSGPEPPDDVPGQVHRRGRRWWRIAAAAVVVSVIAAAVVVFDARRTSPRSATPTTLLGSAGPVAEVVWQTKIPVFAVVGVDARRIYATTPNRSSGTFDLVALDTRSGRELWRLPTGRTTPSVLVSTDFAAVWHEHAASERDQTVDLETGRAMLTTALPAPYAKTCTAGTNLIAMDVHSAATIAIDARSGRQAWTAAGHWTQCAVVGGIVVLSAVGQAGGGVPDSMEGLTIVVALQSGRVLWRQRAGQIAAVTHEGPTVVMCVKDVARGLDVRTGAERWHRKQRCDYDPRTSYRDAHTYLSELDGYEEVDASSGRVVAAMPTADLPGRSGTSFSVAAGVVSYGDGCTVHNRYLSEHGLSVSIHGKVLMGGALSDALVVARGLPESGEGCPHGTDHLEGVGLDGLTRWTYPGLASTITTGPDTHTLYLVDSATDTLTALRIP